MAEMGKQPYMIGAQIMSTQSLLRDLGLGDLQHELATTRRVLERVPEGHFSWKPHEKSMSVGRLANHIVEIVSWQTTILRTDELDIATMPPRSQAPTSRNELLRAFDAGVTSVNDALEVVDEKDFGKPWTLRRGVNPIFTQPRFIVFRSMGVSHMINHRAQLCVYFRLLNVPVPQIYGPTADDPEL